MTGMHCGYEHRVGAALCDLLGAGFWSRELSVSTFRPRIEYPGMFGEIQARPVDRMAIVVECDLETAKPILEAIERVRRERAGLPT